MKSISSIIIIFCLSTCVDKNNAEDSIRENRPNIILIMSDDMGYSDIGCYGSEIETPVLDKLANEGVRFSQFYNTARCCPTRASLLTGLYPSQTGMGFMTTDQGKQGYRGEIGDQCVTIAEVLQPAGYKTYMTGKWHVARRYENIEDSIYNWPLQRGFDRFYGTINGAGSYWDPYTLTRGNQFISPFNDPEYTPEGKWYYTDAISDNAVKFIEKHNRDFSGNPFFMYVSYTAAHWPLHAPEDEIALHQGRYDEGYHAIRQKRYEKLQDLGLIGKNWKLSRTIASCDTTEYQSWHARNMEVYAAMITRMDKGIGKIVNKLNEQNQLDNTLILYLHDNGGCDEILSWHLEKRIDDKPSDVPTYAQIDPHDIQISGVPVQTREGYPVVLMKKSVMAGSEESYHAYGPYWANVSNTPFRKFKKWVHEGGISTPLIAHWPEQIKDHGQIRRQPSHVIDIMATIIDVTGAEYPKNKDRIPIIPYEGHSLYQTLTNNDTIQHRTIYFEHNGNRAVRQGAWKLVSEASQSLYKFNEVDTIPLEAWRLFNINEDRTEMNDLSKEHPEIVKEMAEKWQIWAMRTNTIPKPK